MCPQDPGSLNSNSIICSISIFPSYFFYQKYFVALKLLRWRWIVIQSWYNRWLRVMLLHYVHKRLDQGLRLQLLGQKA